MKILITGGNGNIATILKNNLTNSHQIYSPCKNELNLLNFDNVKDYLQNNLFDVCFHTAIDGGRRIKEDDYYTFYVNLLMFQNLLFFKNNFKIIFNMDSGAIYDRKSDIYNKKEEELDSIPTDFYGFSKFCIYQLSLGVTNMYNLRIFNIFHPNEESDRFIKMCICNKEIKINDDKYFDFFYYTDFIKVIEHYLNNINNLQILDKTINMSYNEKYKLSEIAKIINPNINIIIENINDSKNNYTGNSEKLDKLNLNLIGLKNAVCDYKKKI